MVRKIASLIVLGTLASCGESGQAHLARPRKEDRPYETSIRLITKESREYNLPLRGFDGHVEMVVGAGQTPQLHFYEARSELEANVHPGEFFVATVNGNTRVIQYVDQNNGELLLWDLSNPTTDRVPYNLATRVAYHTIANVPRRMVLSLQNVLAIDQDGSGWIDGLQSLLISIDGTRISQEDLRPR